MIEIQCRRFGGSICDFSLRCSTSERPPSALAASLWLLIWAPLNHKESFFADILLLRVHNSNFQLPFKAFISQIKANIARKTQRPLALVARKQITEPC